MSKKSKCLAALVAALVVPFVVAGDEMQTVIVTGMGETIAVAKDDAYRNAVQKVMSKLMDSDVRIENDTVVKDKILSYSAGYVEAAEVIEGPIQIPGGLVRVKIRARVRKTALENKVREIKPSVAEISGEDIYARIVSSSDQHEHGSDMIADLFENIREKLVKVETVPGRNGRDPIDVDPATKELFVNVRVSIDKGAYRRFLKDASMKLRPMSTGTIRAKKDTGRLGNQNVTPFGGKMTGRKSRYNHGKREKGIGALLVFAEACADNPTFLTFDDNTFHKIASCASLGDIVVKVQVLDASGDVIRQKTETIATERKFMEECFPGYAPWKYTPTVWLAPILQGSFQASGQEEFFFTTWVESATIKVPIGSFTPEEGRHIARVKASLDGGDTDLF